MFTDSEKVKAVEKVVSHQIGESVETRLMYEIFSRALHDAFFVEKGKKGKKGKIATNYSEIIRQDAKRYLRSSMPHLVAIGIEPEWVRRLMKKAGLDIAK